MPDPASPPRTPDRLGDRPSLHPSLTVAPDELGAGHEAVLDWMALVAAGRFGAAPPPRDPAIAANLAATDAIFRARAERHRAERARW